MQSRSLLVFLRTLLASAIILLSANISRGVSVSEYQQNLKQAITALDSLNQSDEEETQAVFEKRFDQTVDAVRKSLPETMMVECGEELCTVDNSWLHEDLKELSKAGSHDWVPLLARILEKLKSIEERVAEMQAQTAASTNKTTEKQKLSEILSRPEYQKTNRANSALARLLDKLVRWLSKLFGKTVPVQSRRSAPVNAIAQILVVALALAVLAYIARLVLPRVWKPRRRQRKAKLEPRVVLGERLEPDQSAVDLLSEADKLARSGQIRAAIRKTYIALLVELGDRKVLSLAQHKTNRDYLRSLRTIPSLYGVMSGITDSFERHWYGFVEASPDDWQRFREKYRMAMETTN